jgi:protein SCO1/2
MRYTRSRNTHSALGSIVLAGLTAIAGTPAGAQDASAEPVPVLDAREALIASQSVIGKQIGDFTLLDREGRPVRLSQYRGKPLLVSFIYTACFQVCPLTTKTLQTAVENGRDYFGTNQYNVISIGFNQPADTPQALKSFAQQHRIQQPNWDFLSPHPSIVEPLTQAFGFRYAATPAGFDHLLQVTLVDGNGRIYRQIYGEELTAASLGEPLKDLMRDAPIQEKLKIDDLVERVKILCTVYDPKTGRYRVRYDMVLQIAGGVTFAIVMIWFLGAEWLGARKRRVARAASGVARA